MTRAMVRGLVAAGLLTAVTSLSGCAVLSPMQTARHAVVGDGVPVNLGPIVITNLLVVAEEEGGPGVLAGSVVNTSSEAIAIDFVDTESGTSARVALPAGAATSLSGGASPVQLDQVSVGPGGLVQLDVTTAATGAAQVWVPVLHEQPYLATLTPTVPAATETATQTAAS